MTDELRYLDYQRKTTTIHKSKLEKNPIPKKIILIDPSNNNSIRWTHSLKKNNNKSKSDIYLEDDISQSINSSEYKQMKDIDNSEFSDNITNSKLEKEEIDDSDNINIEKSNFNRNEIDFIELKENTIFNEKFEENKSNVKNIKEGNINIFLFFLIMISR